MSRSKHVFLLFFLCVSVGVEAFTPTPWGLPLQWQGRQHVPEQHHGGRTIPSVVVLSMVAKDVNDTSVDNTFEETTATPNASEDIDIQACMQTLEKRLKEGPGTLSTSELSELEATMERLVGDLQSRNTDTDDDDDEETDHDDTSDEPVVASQTVDHPAKYSQDDLRAAVAKLDATAISTMMEEQPGLGMDEATTEAAFWKVVQSVDLAEQRDEPLSADVPTMLHHIFDADLRHLLENREQQRTNVTCKQPDHEGMGIKGQARSMNYIFDDSAHKDLPLAEGRKCEGGTCCEACSRNIFPTFATEAETSLEIFPELASLTFNDLATVTAKTILQFTRLVERVRRTIAVEYGLPLSTILPLQAYSRKYVAGTTQKGGGGGEGDFVTLHTDEATHSGYHYSCVLYLSTEGKDFEGGAFVFNDPDEEASNDTEKGDEEEEEEEEDEELLSYTEMMEKFRYQGRKLTPFHPTQGAAVIFSSGWENMHEVEKITSGVRYVVPCFFTTCPVPEAAYEQMVAGKPKSTEDIADDWLHLLLAHRKETPMESVGRVKELLMKWHYMCTPLTEH